MKIKSLYRNVSRSIGHRQTTLIIGYCVFLLVFHGLQASVTYLNGDETFILLAWAQRGIKNIFTATRLNTLSPPLDFFVGSAVWRLQENIFGDRAVYHLEFFARTYCLLLMTTGTFFLLKTVAAILNDLWLFLGFIAVFLTQSAGLNFFFIETRLYASLFFFTCLSWYLWLKYLQASKEQKHSYLKGFLVVSGLGYWFHIFYFPNLFLQLLGLLGLLVLDRKATIARIQALREKYFILVFHTLSFGFFCMIYKYRMAKLESATFNSLWNNFRLNPLAIFENWIRSMTLFFPGGHQSIPALLPLVLALPLVFRKKLHGFGIFAILAAQAMIFLTLICAFLAYPRQNFDFRHVFFAIPIVFLALAYTVKNLVELLKVRRTAGVALVATGIYLLIINGHVVAKQEIPNFESLIEVRKRIITQNLKAIGYFGIRENADLSLTTNEQGVTLSFNHIVTLKGLHALPIPKEVYSEHLQKYGFLSRPCSERDAFAPLTSYNNDAQVLVDFCDLKKVVIREASPKL